MPQKRIPLAPPAARTQKAGNLPAPVCRRGSPFEFDDARLTESILQDNPILFEKISAALACCREEAPIALREVVRFLCLVADYHKGQLTPSRRVDLAWHEFLLCTRAYRRFCMTNFGRMIHHDPGGSLARHREQFQTTLRHYRARFGVPDRIYWGVAQADATECGSCEALPGWPID